MARLRGPVAAAWLSVGGATLCAVFAIRLLLAAPWFDLVVVSASLALTGGAGAMSAMLAPAWASKRPLRWQLAAFSVIGLVGLLLNVAVAASLMFLSPHDLKLLLVLCVFALVGTVGPAQLMSRSVSRRVEALEKTTAGIAEGDLAVRAQVVGDDEIARLAASLNSMAGSLEATRRQRDDLELARRDLFAAISHDLRTPLATMRVMVEAIADGVVTDSATRERYFASISGEIQRLSALIDDLFEITTLDSGALRLRIEMIQVEDVVAEAIDTFRPQVEKAGIHLAFEPGSGTNPVQADPQRLSRVLYNLLQNAIRHTPGDGTIVLRTAQLESGVQVAVCDSGEGITSEDAPFIFDRFYRGDKARSRDGAGSGLGLAIARGIVEAHGGRIWVETGTGRGATVAFMLPAPA